MKQFTESNKKRSIALKKYWANKKDHTSPFKGKTYEERFGIEKAQQLKKQRSERIRGNKNPVNKIGVKEKISQTAINNYKSGNRKLPNNNCANGYFRTDINQYTRSNWEANFIRILKLHNIQYVYELPIPIMLNNRLNTYFVDLYLPQYNLYIEIKGDIYSRDKYLAFCEQYNYKSVLIDKNIWNKIKELYSYKIVNWEGRKKYPSNKVIPSETICRTELFKLLNISEDIVQSA